MFRVRGEVGDDPTEPFHSVPYAFAPVPDEPPIARARAELKALGLHPATLPLGVDIEAWLNGGRTGWDAFPNTGVGKMDAESAPLVAALRDTDITLLTGAHVGHLELASDGRTIAAVHYRHDGQSTKVSPKLVILSAGAIMSSVILQRSRSPKGNGLANSSGQVGRNFMNHNSVAMLAIDPRRRNDSVYQKTLMLNDYYLSGGSGGKPLGAHRRGAGAARRRSHSPYRFQVDAAGGPAGASIEAPLAKDRCIPPFPFLDRVGIGLPDQRASVRTSRRSPKAYSQYEPYDGVKASIM